MSSENNQKGQIIAAPASRSKETSPEPGSSTSQTEVIKVSEIQRMNIEQLNQFAKKLGLKHLGSLTKSQMVFEIVKCLSMDPKETLSGEGVLEILPDGFGFLRSPN